MNIQKPTFITKSGQPAEGQTLTDLQEYNQRLQKLTQIMKLGIAILAIIGGGFLFLAIFILVEVMRNNILTNIVGACL